MQFSLFIPILFRIARLIFFRLCNSICTTKFVSIVFSPVESTKRKGFKSKAFSGVVCSAKWFPLFPRQFRMDRCADTLVCCYTLFPLVFLSFPLLYHIYSHKKSFRKTIQTQWKNISKRKLQHKQIKTLSLGYGINAKRLQFYLRKSMTFDVLSEIICSKWISSIYAV